MEDDPDHLLPRWLEEELKADLKEAGGDKIDTLSVMLRFFKEIGIDEALLKPLDDVYESWLQAALHGPYGGNARPIRETSALAHAAAAVAILVDEEGCILADALSVVEKEWLSYPHAPTADKIQKFRNELSRGNVSRVARMAYGVSLEKIDRRALRRLVS